MKLVIDRKRWLRGEGPADSKLLRGKDNEMCCLGFFGCALGATEDELVGVVDPEDVRLVQWPEWLVENCSDDAGGTLLAHTDEAIRLMRINDTKGTPEHEREAAIARIFASHGVEVTFVDGEEPSC